MAPSKGVKLLQALFTGLAKGHFLKVGKAQHEGISMETVESQAAEAKALAAITKYHAASKLCACKHVQHNPEDLG